MEQKFVKIKNSTVLRDSIHGRFGFIIDERDHGSHIMYDIKTLTDDCRSFQVFCFPDDLVEILPQIKRVRLKNDPILEEQFRGIAGTLVEEQIVTPPSGKPYTMWTVILDDVVTTNNVDGYGIKHISVNLPETLFEEI